MRISFRLGILAACLLAPSIAAADSGDDGTGWYLGGELGRTTVSTRPADGPVAGSYYFIAPYKDPALVVTRSFDWSSTSAKLEAGYWFNGYVGLQAGYLDMGTYSDVVRYHDPHGGICYQFSCSTDFTDSNKLHVTGTILALTGRLPLPAGFELLARLGWFSGQATYDESTAGIKDIITPKHSLDYSAVDRGLGLGWRFTSHWGVQLWWDKYSHSGSQPYRGNIGYVLYGPYTPFDVKGYSLAVQYHF